MTRRIPAPSAFLTVAMFIIYDFIFLIFAIFNLPAYLFRRKFHRNFFMRLGIIPSDTKLMNPIWIHAVSVGEAVAVRSLIAELRRSYPGRKFVLSTVTPTGNKIVQSIAKEGDFITYLPLDLSFIVKRVIDKVKPSLFMIAETEIWPNLISYLHKKNIPIVTVNGRISDASFKGYSSIKFLLKPVLNKVSLFCVQGSRDAERLKNLGVAQDKIKITGNMKFDNVDYSHQIKDSQNLRLKFGMKNQDKLLVAGSTHPGEEEIILSIYKDLITELDGLKLLIAPRHPERSKEIAGLASSFGLRGVLVSTLASNCSTCIPEPVFILDTIGQLMHFYSISEIVFVGGSLVKKGGHNILEPASFAKPVIFGPFMFNFRDIAELFISNKAAILVNNPQELKIRIRELFKNAPYCQDLGRRAKDLIQKNSGSTRRNIELIKTIIR